MIFKDKKTFITNYLNRVEQTYGMRFDKTTKYQKYVVLATLVREYAAKKWIETKAIIDKKQLKQVYYFSMEFLMGRLLTNNLMNLRIYEVVDSAMKDLGIDLNDIESEESDMGLGNGGLGRLAACFLDSIASLSYPGHGNCIRYRSGFFKQEFINGNQFEFPESWLQDDLAWEVRKEDEAVEIQFYDNDKALSVKAIPYDVPIVGHDNNVVNTLTMWSAEPTGAYPEDVNVYDYDIEVRRISENLYPDDSTEAGKLLRLKQQYFFVSAGLQRIIKNHKKQYNTLDNFHEKIVLHINDTHPTLIIPELMRILIDEENYSWDKAWNITQNTCAYTNHTILVEALEKWPVKYIKELLPRIYSIIEVINTQFKQQLLQKYSLNEASVNSLAIINNGIIHMAHLCIVGSFSVNGVAELHTKILRSVEMKAFNEIFPHKFNNKTNGVTHRRWLYHCNPELSAFLNKYIGSNWVKNINELSKLKQFVFDKQIKSEFYQLKQKRKQKLSDLIYQKEGVKLNVDSIFDVQVKRLHEYKRQLMNALHIMHLYNKLKTDKEFYHNFYPQSFIFGAKAAGSYVMAKKIIKLINTISEIVNHDDEVNEKLKVVFVENYNVSYAELIMPAANVSEQISTASKEASGTGNMKFMMNGALTLGTLDGANVEIYELVGSDNIFIFGMTADEVSNHYVNNDYNPRDIYNSEPIVKEVVDNLVNGFFKNVPKAEFKMIYDDLLTKDYFFVLKDFKSYLLAQRQVNELYKNQDKWLEMALINIANSAYFSSDRTISQYAQEIWNLDKITF